MSDDLTIQLFFFTSAVLAGVEAMKATGWRAKVFWGLAGAFVVAGVAWSLIKRVYPPLTNLVGDVATNPQSWFILIVLGLVLVAITGRGVRNRAAGGPNVDVNRDVPSFSNSDLAGAYDVLQVQVNELVREMDKVKVKIGATPLPADYIRKMDRTAFLVSSALVQDLYRKRLLEALAHVPKAASDAIDTDEKLIFETERINEYLRDVHSNLASSHWVNNFGDVLHSAENQADHELLGVEAPDGVNPFHYRLFHIACVKRDKTEAFLKRSITAARDHEVQMLQMLRERPELHK